MASGRLPRSCSGGSGRPRRRSCVDGPVQATCLPSSTGPVLKRRRPAGARTRIRGCSVRRSSTATASNSTLGRRDLPPRFNDWSPERSSSSAALSAASSSSTRSSSSERSSARSPRRADVSIRPVFHSCTVESLTTGDTATSQFTLYRGATPSKPIDGMFSFVPCMEADDPRERFERPAIVLLGLPILRAASPLRVQGQSIFHGTANGLAGRDEASSGCSALPRHRPRDASAVPIRPPASRDEEMANGDLIRATASSRTAAMLPGGPSPNRRAPLAFIAAGGLKGDVRTPDTCRSRAPHRRASTPPGGHAA